MGEEQQLKITVEDGVLSISIGVEALCHACEIGRRYATGDIEITDTTLFVEGLHRQLESEDADGSTQVHIMLDATVNAMLENGEPGLEELEDE